jgi:tRNA A-37 threonylcarbamoyl transferase component Bud32
MKLQPISKPRATTNDLYELMDGPQRYLVKVYQGRGGKQRRDCEQGMLQLWDREGFDVPKVFEVQVEGVEGPYLVMSYIPGASLQRILQEPQTTLEEKLPVWGRVLRAVRERHDKGIETDRLELFHPDSSTGNIIPNDEGVFFFDLEAGARSKGVREAAAVEIDKLCRWAVRDLGVRYCDDLLRDLIRVYADRRDVLEDVVRRARGRLFQFFHRLRDRRRKEQRGGVSKYDIADALQRLLEQ